MFWRPVVHYWIIMEQACKEGRSEAAAAICLRLKEEARRCADAVPDAKMKVN